MRDLRLTELGKSEQLEYVAYRHKILRLADRKKHNLCNNVVFAMRGETASFRFRNNLPHDDEGHKDLMKQILALEIFLEAKKQSEAKQPQKVT